MPVEAVGLIGHSATQVATRLFIIDDDQELTGLLRELLRQEGFDVETHAGGPDAAARAISGNYALVILDFILPDVNGFVVLKEIRRTSSVPVILLTARGADVDRIVGLEIGADDYVPKPFNARELTARIRAVLRRLEPRPGDRKRAVVGVDDVSLELGARAVMRDGTPVELTTVEFDILRLLVESGGQTVTRERISEQVLGRPFDPFDRSVDMHISNLRRKLGPRLGNEERIKTIRSVGYIYTLPLDR
jgi:two-component system response regulator CpxR